MFSASQLSFFLPFINCRVQLFLDGQQHVCNHLGGGEWDDSLTTPENLRTEQQKISFEFGQQNERNDKFAGACCSVFSCHSSMNHLDFVLFHKEPMELFDVHAEDSTINRSMVTGHL